MNKKKIIKAVRVLIMVILAMCLLCQTASAATLSDVDDVPYTSYTFWQGYEPKKAFPTKSMFNVNAVLNNTAFGSKSLNNATHMASDAAGENLYVLDGGNGRIVQISLKDYSLVAEVSEIVYNGEVLSFTGAKGIYVSADGHIYICDTTNRRIIITDTAYNVTEIMTSPADTLLPEGFDFKPTRVVVDNKNFTFVLCEGCYYGALAYDENLNFKTFYGANIVKSDVLSTIKDLITSLFKTNEKAEASLSKLPSEFTDLCISPDGFLYTVSSNDMGQLRKLGPKGTNTLTYSVGTTWGNADDFDFGDTASTISRDIRTLIRSFAGITIDQNGFIYLVDSVRGRIYMYDEDCRLLSVFGGGLGTGEQKGTFQNSNAIVAVDDRLLILDSMKGTVTVMKTTEYGQTVMKADLLTLNGSYEEAKPYWEKVLSEDKNSQIAYNGLAKAAYIEGDYKTAMDYAEDGLDTATYAQAFAIASNNYLKDNILWISLLCLLAIGLVVFFLIYTKRNEVVLIKNDKLRTALSLTVHPFVSANDIKYKGMGSVPIATVFIIVYFLMSVFQILYGGFMHVGIQKENINIMFTFVGTAGLILLWVISNWGVCILTEGKGRLKEVYCASAYCLLPSIIGSTLYMILSHIVVVSDFSSLGVMTTICTIYTIILLLVTMTVVHDFSFFKSIGTAVLSIFGMLLCAFVIFVVFMLLQDFAGFIVGIFREVAFR